MALNKKLRNTRVKGEVLVTGASGDIGFAVCETLLKNGYNILAHYNSSDKMNKRILTCAKENKLKATLVRADFGHDKGLQSFIKFLIKRGRVRKINAVIHCAGLNEKKSFKNITIKDFNKIFSINTKAPLFITQALIYGKVLTRKSSIVFVGSPNSFIGGSVRNMLYTGSKTALLGWHKNLVKGAPYDLQVNTIVPGYVDTKMLREKNNAIALGKKQSYIPANRFASPDEVAEMINFLISKKGKYVTGQAVHLNGGLYLS